LPNFSGETKDLSRLIYSLGLAGSLCNKTREASSGKRDGQG